MFPVILTVIESLERRVALEVQTFNVEFRFWVSRVGLSSEFLSRGNTGLTYATLRQARDHFLLSPLRTEK